MAISARPASAPSGLVVKNGVLYQTFDDGHEALADPHQVELYNRQVQQSKERAINPYVAGAVGAFAGPVGAIGAYKAAGALNDANQPGAAVNPGSNEAMGNFPSGGEGPMAKMAVTDPDKYRLLQMHMGALSLNAYRPEAANARMSEMGQRMSAYGPANRMLGQMYGQDAMFDPSAIKNPMSQGMMGIGTPNKNDLGLSAPPGVQAPGGPPSNFDPGGGANGLGPGYWTGNTWKPAPAKDPIADALALLSRKPGGR